MKAKILLIAPRGFSPKRHYRGEGVMERLTLLDPEVQIVYPTSDELWKDLIKCDLVYMFHAIEPAHVEVVKQCLNMGIPVWVDYDDDLFNVPLDNPNYAGIKAALPNFMFMLKNASMVTCNTNPLARVLGGFLSKEIMVIPNAIDDYVFTDLGQFAEGDKDCMSWRGGASHQADLLNFADEFWKFLGKTDPKVFLNFVGHYPHWIEKGFAWNPVDYEGRTEHWPYILNHYEYIRHFHDVVKPWANVVPLTDNLFNRSKSNIAALESIYAGTIPVVPDWEGWNEFPVKAVYNDKVAPFQAMCGAMEMSANDRMWAQRENAEYVREKYSLSKVNLRRLNVIAAMLELKR